MVLLCERPYIQPQERMANSVQQVGRCNVHALTPIMDGLGQDIPEVWEQHHPSLMRACRATCAFLH
ncbi:hypothetical protein Sp245p_28195 (plasmid) [Azospirillum baldaniorum]|uniref:Uncharacterized protein n=1 Tax=Azospirillum baldaniorum TaxID=1064539 RepID=A0A9P1JXX0_9PROT|nr:hypothetical protein Sp245p_28195 [Azospirillum baldaniorum]CCD01838.1 protein of unknown function [Azospirillum baldaniorum]